MKQLNIAELQQLHVNFPFLAHHAPTEKNCTKFREGRNELKSRIKETKAVFYNKMFILTQ